MAAPRRPLLALARLASGRTGRDRRVRGFVDALVGGDTVVGWAQDPRDPARRLVVQMLKGDDIVAFGVADLPRKDLVEAAIGDGRYGFRLRVPAALLDGGVHPVRLLAVTERGKVLLQRGELSVAPVAPAAPAGPKARAAPAASPEPEAKPRSGALVGTLERLDGGLLHGWAYNPDQPDAPALVDLFDDERYLGSVLADRSRPRLYEKGFPSGARGFQFELPDGPPVMAARLRGRVAGTSYELRRTRDYEKDAARDALASPAPAAQPVVAPSAAPAVPSDEPRQPPLAGDGLPVALWPAGAAGGPDDPVLADWAAQTVDAWQVGPPDAAAGAGRLLCGADPVAEAARLGAWLLFAPAGARLDPALAAAIAHLPGFPDVLVLGGEPQLPDEAARLETWLRPDAPGAFAARADVVAAYPGPLAAERTAGWSWPLRMWLAEREDLRWAWLPCPDPGGRNGDDPDRADRTGPDWRWTQGRLRPARMPARISLALWDGWDMPGLPAVEALLAAAGDGPLDLLVPTGGDEAVGRARLTSAEAVLARRSAPAARARLVDTPAAGAVAALLRAADGEVAVLSDGRACPNAPTLARMAAWALHPAVGPVGLAAGGWTTAARLDGTGTLFPADEPGAVSAVSWGLMAVATRRVAAADPSIGGPLGLPGGAALWSLQLQAHGWQPVVLDGTAAGTAPSGFVPGPLPWPTRATLRAARMLP